MNNHFIDLYFQYENFLNQFIINIFELKVNNNSNKSIFHWIIIYRLKNYDKLFNNNKMLKLNRLFCTVRE